MAEIASGIPTQLKSIYIEFMLFFITAFITQLHVCN
jgi:hypothetical protein